MRSHSSGHPAQRAALLVGIAALGAAGGSRAELAQVPLTLANAAKPNIMLVIDDSGSMDGELLFPTNDGALWWNTSTHTFFGQGRGGATGFNYNDAGSSNATWKKYIYLFPNGTGTGNRVYGDGNNDHFAVPPVPEFGFARSPDYNGQYFDPGVEYLPWEDGGGYTFSNANPSAAPSDPVSGSGTLDLTGTIEVSDGNWRFRLHEGMREPDGSVFEASDYANQGGKVGRSRTFAYHPASYYLRIDEDIAFSIAGSSYNCNAPDPAAYTGYFADRPALQSGLEALGIDALAPDGACLELHRIDAAADPGGMQNFANWFTYHRKRHQALRAGAGSAFSTVGGVRVGGFTISDRDDVTMWDLDAGREDLLSFLYEIDGNAGGTPNRQALMHAGTQFDEDTDIVQYACQQNFALQFTDGFATLWTGAGVGNADGDAGEPYADSYENTLADIAHRFYADGIRSDLDPGKVPVPAACAEASPPGWLDCNADPHMTHYGVTLGSLGDIYGVTHHTAQDVHESPPGWQNPNAERSPVQVDDLFHATVNGHGVMVNAQSTDELTEALNRALRAILDSVISSASVVASNSTRLDTDTLVYQARFDSRRWSGELLAFSLTGDGELDEAVWDAGDLIPTAGARAIYTTDTSGDGIEFEWDELDPAQQADLHEDAEGTNDGRGPERLDYLRGVRALEAQHGGPFRTRDSVLGDIVNSSPWFVGAQNFGYERLPSGAAGRDSYQAFVAANASRRKMIYVGANDGMLHGFDAETGIERFAYVPRELIQVLPQLTAPDYEHRYFVDGSPVAGDAYFGGAWKTVLVGSNGAGGRSVFALDVTDPDGFGTGNVLWEFTDADLGHVVGRPSIARMANGRWAAIFGSGYGLDKSAKLFIVDLEHGTLLAKISTVRSSAEGTADANGMGPPFPVDVDGDAISDVIYAGDLYGNLWKFDVDGNAANSWGSDYSGGSPPAPRPLVTVCASGNVGGPFACPGDQRQPITMRPVVGRGHDGGLAVYFGTGKFFESGDNAVTGSGPVQSFYGVFDANTQVGSDDGDRVAGRGELVEQQIIAEVEFDANDHVRVTSQNPVGADARGWYLDLVSPELGFQGERAISQPLLREGRLIFTTLIPSSDPCDGGGSSWLMELSALDGGRFDYPVFDLDDDGGFTEDDMVTIVDGDGNEIQVPPSGRRSGVGVIQTPAIIEAGEVEYKITGGSSGGIESVRERGRLSKGRNSWRQLWPGQ